MSPLQAILKETGVICAALPIAARWHDLGKAHEAFQSKIKLDRRVSPDGKEHTPIAKAPDGAWKHQHERDAEGETLKRRRHFRHELASALAVLQPTIGDKMVEFKKATKTKPASLVIKPEALEGIEISTLAAQLFPDNEVLKELVVAAFNDDADDENSDEDGAAADQ